MKKLVASFFVFFTLAVKAQVNLVPNPSFELYDTCPGNVGEVFRTLFWESFANSPDYFHTCATSSVISIPTNAFGKQIPASGVAYCGFYTFCSDYREYLGAPLLNPLSIGQKYFVSFKISRSNDIGAFSCSSNNQGVLFTNTQYSEVSPLPTNNVAHVFENSIVTDSLNWTVVFGSFISDSAYQYIVLGNFFSDANTNTLGSLCSYYYIDDICVSTDSTFASTWTGITNNVINNLQLFPNPVSTEMTVTNYAPDCSYKIIDLLGRESASGKLIGEISRINVSEMREGIYFFVLNNAHTFRIIINR